jgi:voltage-gated potassium channel
MIQKLKQIVENNDSAGGRIFDTFIQSLIVLSLVAFSIETLPNFSPTVAAWLAWIELLTVAAFTIEYVLRILVAERKLAYIFSFYGIIDLLAILPFYLAVEFDLRAIRAFRFFRLFRTFKVIRYNKAIRRFHRAFIIAKEEIVLFLIVAVLLLYFSAVGIYFFENEAQPESFASIFHSLWWAVATLTTVGYGDIYPVTIGGKVFTFFVLIVGLGIVAVPAGLVASALSKARELEE